MILWFYVLGFPLFCQHPETLWSLILCSALALSTCVVQRTKKMGAKLPGHCLALCGFQQVLHRQGHRNPHPLCQLVFSLSDTSLCCENALLCLLSSVTVCSSLFSPGLVRKQRHMYWRVQISSVLCLTRFAPSCSLTRQNISTLQVLLPLPLLLFSAPFLRYCSAPKLTHSQNLCLFFFSASFKSLSTTFHNYYYFVVTELNQNMRFGPNIYN